MAVLSQPVFAVTFRALLTDSWLAAASLSRIGKAARLRVQA
jgi:hypothetical protein